jgi:hypothetical protein
MKILVNIYVIGIAYVIFTGAEVRSIDFLISLINIHLLYVIQSSELQKFTSQHY